MKTARERYSDYKTTGVPSIGTIPSHWDRLRLKQIVDRKRPITYGIVQAGPNQQGGVPYIRPADMSEEDGIVDFDNLLRTSEEIARNYRRSSILEGDLVCSIGPSFGKVMVVPAILEGGNLTQGTARIAVESTSNCRFVFWLLRSSAAFQQWESSVGGATFRALNLRPLSETHVPCPPLKEQTQIAKFLDYETAKIDTLIEKQQQLIALLKEKRQAVISHAVTKGLNPDAPMRDSGIEWLGEVPAHWSVQSLRRVLINIEQGTSPIAADTPPTDGEQGVVKLSSIKSGKFLEKEAKTLESTTLFDDRYSIHVGDLLVTRGNTPELVADACVVTQAPYVPLMMSDLVYRLNVNSRALPEYLCFCLLSSFGRAQIKTDARGSSMSMAKVSQSHIQSWRVALPDTSEQLQIVDFLAKALARFDSLMEASDRQRALLIERRTALVSAAVTGKIDVRSWKPPETSTEQSS